MKYIITQAYSQGDWFNKDVALISVTDKFKEKLVEIRDFIFSAPPDVFERVRVYQYNFGMVEFVDSTLIEDLEDDEINDDISTVEAWCVNGRGEDSEVEITDILNMHPIEGEVSGWYTYAVVSSSGVVFKANNKYGDMEEMWTDNIPFEMILNF